MRRLVKATQGVVLADTAFALALPPPTYGVVPDEWNDDDGVVPLMELEVWANAGINLTNAILYAAHQHPLVQADVELDSVTNATDTLNEAAHGLLTGDGPFQLKNRAALVYADRVFTADATTDLLTTAAVHGLQQGDGPLQVSNAGGALPTGLTAVTDYWVIYVSTTQFKLATSLNNADAGVAVDITTNGTGVQTLEDTVTTTRYADDLPAGLELATDYWIIKTGAGTFKLAASVTDALSAIPVSFSDDGTGTHLLVDTADTQRVHWHSHGLLGLAEDGAIALTAQLGYSKRFEHRARAIAYALSATLDVSDPEGVSAAIYPVVEV